MKIRRRLAVHSGILFSIVLLFSEPIHAQKPAADDLLVLNNVAVVDVQTGALQPEQTVILERNHIASVGPSKLAKYPRNAPSVNCRGLFLIPGLWDMHVHLVFGDWFPGAQDISLPLFVANGITGDELSPLLRTAFVLREVQGYSTGEAAKKLGVTENTLKARLWRARHQLAERL